MDEDEASSLVGMAKLNDYFCLYNNFDKHVSKMKKLAGADKIFVELYAREHQLALSSKNDTTAESEPHKEAYEVSQADIDREEALADFEGKIEEELARQANSLGPKSKVAPHRRLMIREDWLCLSKSFTRQEEMVILDQAWDELELVLADYIRGLLRDAVLLAKQQERLGVPFDSRTRSFTTIDGGVVEATLKLRKPCKELSPAYQAALSELSQG